MCNGTVKRLFIVLCRTPLEVRAIILALYDTHFICNSIWASSAQIFRRSNISLFDVSGSEPDKYHTNGNKLRYINAIQVFSKRPGNSLKVSANSASIVCNEIASFHGIFRYVFIAPSRRN